MEIRTEKGRREINIPIEERLGDISDQDFSEDYDKIIVTVSKTTLKRYESPKFRIDEILQDFADKIFDLDSIDKAILGIIAKNGSLNEIEITKNAWERNKDHTRDKIRYRLYMKSKSLLSLGFISQEEGAKIGNIKSKSVKIYKLTFKGLMASLSSCKFDEIYLIQNFRQLLQKWFSADYISEFSLNFMKYHLALFMLRKYLEGSKLTESKDITSNIYAMNKGDPLIYPSHPLKIDDENLNEIAIDVRVGFHVHSAVIDFALEKIDEKASAESKNHGDEDISFVEIPSEGHHVRFLRKNLEYWYEFVEKLQNKDDNLKLVDHIENSGLEIDHYAVNVIARRILKEHKIHPNFPLSDVRSVIYSI
jgi:hypothetical protein